MLRRMALERLRSPLSRRIVAVHPRGGLVERVGEIGKFVARPFAQQGTEITFGDALRKTLQALHARGEHRAKTKETSATDEQHDEGGDEQPLAKFDEREINLRKRQRQADHDGRSRRRW